MKKFTGLFLASFLVLIAVSAYALDAFYTGTGMLYHNEEKAYQGYTIFSPLSGTIGNQAVWMIDMEGNVVHKWTFSDEYAISYYGRLLESSNLVRALTPHETEDMISDPAQGGIHSTGSIYQEVDWDNNLIWQARDPRHKDITYEEFQSLSGLSDAEMKDEDAIAAAEAAIIANTADPKYSQLLSGFNYCEHHDYRKVWNKNLGKYTLMFISMRQISAEEAEQAGANPATAASKPTYPNAIFVDGISEVDIQTGELIWDWSFADHLIQDYDETKDNWYQNVADQYYGGDVEEAYMRRIDVNMATNQGTFGPHYDWSHINSMDYNAERDEIVLNSRQWSEFFVIDHNLTTEEAATHLGDLKYRFGSPYNYASADQLGEAARATFPTFYSAAYTQIWGAHDIQWIGNGLDGAGNFLIFDNGVGRVGMAHSAVLEINPLDENGDYVPELDAGYRIPPMYPSGNTGLAALLGSMTGQKGLTVNNQVVWGFSSMPTTFYSPYISGCQRLPNGNTLVCSGMHGHFFEVTSEGEIVWEYINPLFNGFDTDVATVQPDGTTPIGGQGMSDNSVFRCLRYGSDFPGLAGKNLFPTGTITDPVQLTGFGFTGGVSGSGGGGSGGGGAAGGGY